MSFHYWTKVFVYKYVLKVKYVIDVMPVWTAAVWNHFCCLKVLRNTTTEANVTKTRWNSQTDIFKEALWWFDWFLNHREEPDRPRQKLHVWWRTVKNENRVPEPEPGKSFVVRTAQSRTDSTRSDPNQVRTTTRLFLQLTGDGAQGERDEPEEERERQSDAQNDHVGHHLDVFLCQDGVLRVHDCRGQDRLQDRTETC